MADSFKIEGLDEVVKNLEALPEKLAKAALKKALQAGGEVLGNAVVERTPEDTGLLKESVGLAVSVAGDGQSGEANVGFGKQDYVARWIEYGHRIVGHKPNKKDTGKHVPARPFIRPAFDASKDQAVEQFSKVISDQVETLGSK